MGSIIKLTWVLFCFFAGVQIHHLDFIHFSRGEMTEIESFSTKHSNNNCSGITIYFCDGIPISTKELARDLVRSAFGIETFYQIIISGSLNLTKK